MTPYFKYVLSVAFLILMATVVLTEVDSKENVDDKPIETAYRTNLASYRSVCYRLFRGRRSAMRDCVYSFIKYGYINYRRVASIKPGTNIGDVITERSKAALGGTNEQKVSRPFFVVRENWGRGKYRGCVTHNIHFLDVRGKARRLPAIRFRTCAKRVTGPTTRRI